LYIKKSLLQLRQSQLGRYLNIPRRLFQASCAVAPTIGRVLMWTFQSREDTNFTYPLERDNERYLAHAIALATGATATESAFYIEEAKNDEQLRRHVIESTKIGPDRSYSDLRCDLGRRLGWYAVVRILKPKVVVETGIDKGLGSVVICAAILKNGMGSYFGTDINPKAGALLKGPYATVGKILFGDSIESLKSFEQTIDLFINDSDHSEEYESKEYEVIEKNLLPGSIVLGDNAHVASKLEKWSMAKGRKFLFWKEQPAGHWYAGAGIGFSFH
jgi:hypothetical protein